MLTKYVAVHPTAVSENYSSSNNFDKSPSSIYFKVFTEGLMVDMALKNISRYTVSYTALPMKTDLHFQPTLS